MAYALTYDDRLGRVTHIKHRRTGCEVEVDAETSITKNFSLKDGWSDSLAQCTNGKAARFYLRDFFGPREGPHEKPEMKGKAKDFDSARKYAAQKMLDMEAAASTGKLQESVQVVQAASDEKKKQRTEKAREALKERKESASKRRRVSVVPATPS